MSTGIEWTDETWNPTVGCSRVSPGCDRCYAVGVAHRALQPAHEGLTIARPGERPDWTGEVRCLPDRLDVPFRWKRPRRVFVDSMSDLFHPAVLEATVEHEDGSRWPFLAEVFAVMAATPRHTFQVLTKRITLAEQILSWPRFRLDVNALLLQRGAEVMPGGMTDPGFTWPANIWLGTSIESDRYVFRAGHLQKVRSAPVRFLSCEPLLGPLPSLDLEGIGWVIVGGESGPGARPIHPDWVRGIRDRCAEAGVPFFFKQWGEWRPGPTAGPTSRSALGHGHFCADGRWITRSTDPESREFIARVGKKLAGRELDGRTHDAMPGDRS